VGWYFLVIQQSFGEIRNLFRILLGKHKRDNFEEMGGKY
jgi:hypothetical protein